MAGAPVPTQSFSPQPALELPKDVFYFAQQRAVLGFVVHARHLIEFLKQFTLSLVQFVRGVNAHFNEQVTLAMTIKHRDPLVANAEGASRLRPFGNLQFVIALKCRYSNLSAERSLGERNRNHAMQIITFTLKKGMFFDMQNDIEIAGWPAESARFP